MKRIFFIICVLILNFKIGEARPRHLKDTLSAKHIEFVENKGQWEQQVLFKAALSGGAMFAENNCLTFVTLDASQLERFYQAKTNPSVVHSGFIDASAYKVHFLNSSAKSVKGLDEESSYNNYYIGDDPLKWTSNVKKYHSILYENIYEGVDLKFYQSESYLKYEFCVAADVSPDVIRLNYEGVKNIFLKNDNLIVVTDVSQIIELKPFAYQISSAGDTVEVDCRFKVSGNDVTYAVGEFDRTRQLVIDPVLIFSSYSGSTSDN